MTNSALAAPNDASSPDVPEVLGQPPLSTNHTAAGQLLDQVLSSEDGKIEDQPAHVMTDSADAGIKQQILQQQIIETLCTIYDPEIPVNIYELGLIYNLQVSPTGAVEIKMTLTSPACPVAGTLPVEVENKVAALPGVTDVNLELVWDPPYSMEMMSEAAQLQLGLL